MHPAYFQLGPLHIPIFGVVAAIGLMAGLALSQRTARSVGLVPDALWDAGITGMIAAFVISRLLLVVFNLHSFLQYPTLLLAVPSLTTTGVLLTAAFLVIYLRWKRLPPLAVLDASAPCAALIWAFVNLGRILEGTKDGMPTSFAWAVGSRMLGRVHPVEVYTLAVALALAAVLLGLLRHRDYTGETTAIALTIAGVAVFFLDFFRLPSDLLPTGWLDPAQFLGVGMIVLGGALLLGQSSNHQSSPPSRHQEPDPIGVDRAF